MIKVINQFGEIKEVSEVVANNKLVMKQQGFEIYESPKVLEEQIENETENEPAVKRGRKPKQ